LTGWRSVQCWWFLPRWWWWWRLFISWLFISWLRLVVLLVNWLRFLVYWQGFSVLHLTGANLLSLDGLQRQILTVALTVAVSEVAGIPGGLRMTVSILSAALSVSRAATLMIYICLVSPERCSRTGARPSPGTQTATVSSPGQHCQAQKN